MSILRKPYEITVWDDVWNGAEGKFVERRIGVIGSDKMEAQCRVHSPNLTRNTNGTKKLTFELYKQYIDSITGESVHNPYYDLLINERKVKLKYDGKWYDFVVKNIQENSSTHLCTYQLEDALVQELSKNGFSLEFNDELMNNNGTVKELAESVLSETGWGVKSEAFVETVEENLVYLKALQNFNAKRIQDQNSEKLQKGVSVYEKAVKIPAGSLILAFYSSCTNKPYRFQFIYVENLPFSDAEVLHTKLIKDDNRFLLNKDCQYYIDDCDFEKIESNYDFYLPKSQQGFLFETTTVVESAGFAPVTLSSEFRGRRYGYSQRSVLMKELGRYLSAYKKDSNDAMFYGYLHTEYKSPALTQSIISNADFKSTAGWIGGRFVNYNQTADKEAEKGSVNNVVGRVAGEIFTNAIEEWDFSQKYLPYMHLKFPSEQSVIFNTGPTDHHREIANLRTGEEWVLTCSGSLNIKDLTFSLGEYSYNDDVYTPNEEKLTFYSEKDTLDEENRVYFTVTKNSYTEDTFKNARIRLKIQGNINQDYYIEKISLFRASYDDNGNLIFPEDQGGIISSKVMDTQYRFYTETDVQEGNTESYQSYKELGTVWKPVIEEEAQKIRTISAKESNYFNILQSIAETFNAWLSLEIIREDNGAIDQKYISFHNYMGKNNYAGFKHGINLKDIQRTFESKQIVTKLIVKDNNNQYAENGFCTIARAGANSSGENAIYDFQYYFNCGLLNPRDYLQVLYSYGSGDEAKGPDINAAHKAYTLYGYFPRLRKLNNDIDEKNSELLSLSKDITQLSAKYEIAVAGKEASEELMEETQLEFQKMAMTDASIEEEDALSKYEGNDDVLKILTKYAQYKMDHQTHCADETRLSGSLRNLRGRADVLTKDVKKLTEHKKQLNKLFYEHYDRFIQEGTWIDESYTDDEKYYADAQSVLYNSCYPKATYSINVVEVSQLPGYEDFTYDLGDKTYVEDKEFFGSTNRVEVIITEITDDLDDPSKNKIKIQTFKNQFQDLFQKITATVQQTKYNTGSYEKAVALAEAGQERKNQFVTDALSGAEARLQIAGQQSVTFGDDGITVIDIDSPCDAIRMVGGAILLSKQDSNGNQKWVTGVTSDGVSASLITAGIINASEVSIMNHDKPTFRWDGFGITAYRAEHTNADGTPVISDVRTNQFVRFDQHGIYGVGGGVNGTTWVPGVSEDYQGTPIKEIEARSTFALTWKGLKVTTSEAYAHIGTGDSDKIIRVVQTPEEGDNKTVFSIDASGNVIVRGALYVGTTDKLLTTYAEETAAASTNAFKTYTTDVFSWSFDATAGLKMWNSAKSGAPIFEVGIYGNNENGLRIKGKIEADSGYFAGELRAAEGYIGGEGAWKIDTGYLKTEIKTGDTITSSFIIGSAKSAGGNWLDAIHEGQSTFMLSKTGILTAKGANISGTITATSGYLGPDATDEQKKNSFCFGEITMLNGGTPRLALYRHLTKEDGKSYYKFDEYPVVLCPYGVKASSILVNNASANSLWVFLIGKATNGKVPFGITDRGALYASAGSIGGLTISENADEGGLTYSSTDFAMQMTKQGFSIGALKTDSDTGAKELDEYKSFLVDSQGAISCHSLKTPYFSLISTAQTTGTVKTFTATAMMAARLNDVESSSMDLIVSVTTSAPLYQSQIFTVSGKVDGITKSFKVRVPAGARYGSVVFYMERAEIGATATCFPNEVEQYPMSKGSVFIGECHIGDGFKEGLNEGHLYVSAYSSIVSTGGDISTASDRHLKKNITNLDKDWDNFYESLKPSIFQYREGPSRWHFGFIAQDVENSLVTEQKQASDYAILTKGLPGYLGLAYTEFVALNTWQILKLKPRITNAEQEIEKLKLEIQQLRTEIETLKK